VLLNNLKPCIQTAVAKSSYWKRGRRGSEPKWETQLYCKQDTKKFLWSLCKIKDFLDNAE
jgi:hypothetical protein